MNLPTGEAALSNMKGYFSSSAGLTYSIKSSRSNLDLGVAGFHLNQPRQTFLQNENQRLAMRQVVHGNFETFITDRATISINAIYQTQARAKYFSAGGAFGYFISDENDAMLNVGMWYWSRSAIVPYLGVSYKDLQFGFSYDATLSKLNQVSNKPKTWEFSVILRGIKDPTGIIPCPWK